ncbi:hypothetical protein QQS21_010744 [Conoideocrella luteorostrata]|uniref:Uncharacterized protein n=1 Tax=Conoideocrella luteorostrata TaxID=1105319 RepID=A0AAJ0CH71_9HYPO|nr:hypothetical protein QQS21_010744 [Conoideocrella luteorostrata]
MGVTLRSQSAKNVKFPVVCTADVDAQILRDLLSNDELALVAKEDLTELITGGNNADLDSFQSPFSGDFEQSYEALEVFIDATQSAAGISRKVFVVLDETTAGDKKTCQIATDGREVDDINEMQFALRCTLSSVPHSLAAVERAAAESPQAIRDLRNEAALVGGVWDKHRVDEFKARPRRIDVADYPVHEDWNDESGPVGPDTDLPYYPVFQTAEISLETLNQFLEEAYSQDWGDEEKARPALAFVTSIGAAPFHQGKAGTHLDSLPPVPQTLFGASAIECDVITRSRFPASGSDMNYNTFIVMDELSESSKTVIIAASNEQDGQLLLARSDFNMALLTMVAPLDTSLTIDSQCNGVMVEGAGIIRDP